MVIPFEWIRLELEPRPGSTDARCHWFVLDVRLTVHADWRRPEAGAESVSKDVDDASR